MDQEYSLMEVQSTHHKAVLPVVDLVEKIEITDHPTKDQEAIRLAAQSLICRACNLVGTLRKRIQKEGVENCHFIEAIHSLRFHLIDSFSATLVCNLSVGAFPTKRIVPERPLGWDSIDMEGVSTIVMRPDDTCIESLYLAQQWCLHNLMDGGRIVVAGLLESVNPTVWEKNRVYQGAECRVFHVKFDSFPNSPLYFTKEKCSDRLLPLGNTICLGWREVVDFSLREEVDMHLAGSPWVNTAPILVVEAPNEKGKRYRHIAGFPLYLLGEASYPKYQ